MKSYTNLGTGVQNFVVGRNDDGTPKTDSIKPGETKPMALNEDHAAVQGAMLAKTLVEAPAKTAQATRKPAE